MNPSDDLTGRYVVSQPSKPVVIYPDYHSYFEGTWREAPGTLTIVSLSHPTLLSVIPATGKAFHLPAVDRCARCELLVQRGEVGYIDQEGSPTCGDPAGPHAVRPHMYLQGKVGPDTFERLPRHYPDPAGPGGRTIKIEYAG